VRFGDYKLWDVGRLHTLGAHMVLAMRLTLSQMSGKIVVVHAHKQTIICARTRTQTHTHTHTHTHLHTRMDDRQPSQL